MNTPRDHLLRRTRVGIALGAVAVASLAVAMPTWAVPSPSRSDELTGLIASPIASPHPVEGTDGERHLVYELHLTNITQSRLVVNSVDTIAGGHVLTHLGHGAVAAQMTPFATGQPGAALRPGGAGVLLLNTALPRSADVPRRLVHAFTITYDPITELPTHERTGVTHVIRDRPAVVDAPLHGARWVDVNGCCGPGGHRSAVNPINGKLYVAERFAIDFVQLTRDRTLVGGDPDQLTSWPSYGHRVLSATRGVVVRTKSGVHDNEPVGTIDPFDLDTIGGNFVVVRFRPGRFAYYAHLQPGSLRVHKGERVGRGDVLGLLGNSGNSDFPHLHFHIMNTSSPLASDGLPYEFRSFSSPGSIANPDQLGAGDPAVFDPDLAGPYSNRLPMDLQVVNFGAVH